MKLSNKHYWHYFLAIEDDFVKALRYVDLDDANMDTFSIEFARIILAVGSEIDVLAKVLCKEHSLSIMPENIEGYRKAITAKFNGFVELEVMILRAERSVKPWESWCEDKSPSWWKAHNDVKHERNVNFKQATLKNTLEAMAGLFVLVCYVCQKELRSNAVLLPQLLSLDPQLSSRISNDLRPGFTLPDFK